VVFVANCFGELIDISQNPPLSFSLPQRLVSTGIGRHQVNLMNDLIVDIESGLLHQISLTLTPEVVDVLATEELWTLVALLAANHGSGVFAAHFFNHLIQMSSLKAVWGILSEFFNFVRFRLPAQSGTPPLFKKESDLPARILPLLKDIKTNFPLAGPDCRVQSFWGFVRLFMNSMSFEQSCDQAIQSLSAENAIAIRLQEALDKWLELYSPANASKFTLLTMLGLQTTLHRLPALFGLSNAIAALPSDSIIPNLEQTLLEFDRPTRTRSVDQDELMSLAPDDLERANHSHS
jgi:hypothetical protein